MKYVSRYRITREDGAIFVGDCKSLAKSLYFSTGALRHIINCYFEGNHSASHLTKIEVLPGCSVRKLFWSKDLCNGFRFLSDEICVVHGFFPRSSIDAPACGLHASFDFVPVSRTGYAHTAPVYRISMRGETAHLGTLEDLCKECGVAFVKRALREMAQTDPESSLYVEQAPFFSAFDIPVFSSNCGQDWYCKEGIHQLLGCNPDDVARRDDVICDTMKKGTIDLFGRVKSREI